MSESEYVKPYKEQVVPVKAWIILGSFLVYTLEDEIEDDSDYIFVVDLSAKQRNFK